MTSFDVSAVESAANQYFYGVYRKEAPVQIRQLVYHLGLNLEFKDRTLNQSLNTPICEMVNQDTLLCNGSLPVKYVYYAVARHIGLRWACVDVKSTSFEDICCIECPFNIFAETLLMPEYLIRKVYHTTLRSHNNGDYSNVAGMFIIPETAAERRLTRFFRNSS